MPKLKRELGRFDLRQCFSDWNLDPELVRCCVRATIQGIVRRRHADPDSESRLPSRRLPNPQELIELHDPFALAAQGP